MSGHPQGGHYDDGYGQPHGQDSYYQDDQYGQYDQRGANGYQDHPNGDAYYDESSVSPLSLSSAPELTHCEVPTMTINKADSISKTVIMTASKVIRMSITTISIMIKEVPKVATGGFHRKCLQSDCLTFVTAQNRGATVTPKKTRRRSAISP
jgi:hypothetical protein